VSVDPDYTSWQRKQRQPVLSHLAALTALSCTGEGLFAVQADEVGVAPESVVVSSCRLAKYWLRMHAHCADHGSLAGYKTQTGGQRLETKCLYEAKNTHI
jgi:hypothetical protein